jgi:hypothetical protein
MIFLKIQEEFFYKFFLNKAFIFFYFWRVRVFFGFFALFSQKKLFFKCQILFYFPSYLSQIFFFSLFLHFLVFKFPKDEVCYYISFIFHFQKKFQFYLFFQIQWMIYVHTHVFFGGLVYICQTCILICIMCLMQTLNNYAIQLQLHHYQL